MKRRSPGAGFAVALGLAGALAAQSSPAAQSNVQPNSSSRSGGRDGFTVTVAGCLEHGTAGAAAPTGTGDNAAPRGIAEWLLTHATIGSSGSVGAAGTGSGPSGAAQSGGIPGVGAIGSATGASTAAAPQTAPTRTGSTASTSGGTGMSSSSYVLEPGSQNLSSHIGHRIEVTGTLAPANSMSGAGRPIDAGTATDAGNTGAPGAGAGRTPAHTTGAPGATPAPGQTGRVSEVPSFDKSPASEPPPGAGAITSGASSMRGGQRLQVNSVRMISSSCE